VVRHTPEPEHHVQQTPERLVGDDDDDDDDDDGDDGDEIAVSTEEDRSSSTRSTQQLQVYLPDGQILRAQADSKSNRRAASQPVRRNSFRSLLSAADLEVLSVAQTEDDREEDDDDDDAAAIAALQLMIRQKQQTLEKLRRLRESPLD
jgi:hypothetical protein